MQSFPVQEESTKQWNCDLHFVLFLFQSKVLNYTMKMCSMFENFFVQELSPWLCSEKRHLDVFSLKITECWWMPSVKPAEFYLDQAYQPDSEHQVEKWSFTKECIESVGGVGGGRDCRKDVGYDNRQWDWSWMGYFDIKECKMMQDTTTYMQLIEALRNSL